jgi:hypothetical protein
MTFTAVDINTGNGIPKVEVTSQYNTSPCPWYDVLLGCTSGDGQNILGYTDQNGNFVWNIPYTCAGSFTDTTFTANGYETQPYGSYAFGMFPGDMQIKVQLVPSTTLPPPGQGLWAELEAAFSNLSYWWGQSTASWWNGILSGGWELAAILVAVGIIIIGIAAILWRAP